MEKQYTVDAHGENLNNEINTNTDLAAKYVHTTYKGNQAYIEFSSDLTAQEETDLDAIIAAHDKGAAPPHFKIYDFLVNADSVDSLATPYDIDFKTRLNITLAKKTLPKIQGKPTSVEYYEKVDESGDYINLICRIDFILRYDSEGFITKKQADLQWYLSDGSLSVEKKDLGQTYHVINDAEFRIKEGKLRRESIVNNLQLPILAGLLETEATLKDEANDEKQMRMILFGRALLTKHQSSFDQFIDHSNKDILMDITVEADTEHDWLDNSVPSWGDVVIRDFILNELNI